jgi:hypothetical protein
LVKLDPRTRRLQIIGSPESTTDQIRPGHFRHLIFGECQPTVQVEGLSNPECNLRWAEPQPIFGFPETKAVC